MARLFSANITWNRYGWKRVDVNPKAGHRAVRDAIANESFNFKFSRHGLNTKTHVYGHVQTRRRLKEFKSPGFIFFVSKNLDGERKRNMVVGIYGNAEFLKNKRTYELDARYKKTKSDGKYEIISTIKAEKNSSVLFPVYLDARMYFEGRPVSRMGLDYDITQETATRIIADEIRAVVAKRDGDTDIEERLYRIFEQVSGKAYREGFDPEQDELDGIAYRESRAERARKVREMKKDKGEFVMYHGRRRRRDGVCIADIKRFRGFKCQICGAAIKRGAEPPYVEAAHIKPKSKGGSENPDNIMILCPNHHKEFDLGGGKVTRGQGRKAVVEMNGARYRLSLDGDRICGG